MVRDNDTSFNDRRRFEPDVTGREPADRIASEIRETRSAMDRTLEEIGEQLEPSRLMDEFWTWARERLPDPDKAAQLAKNAGADVARTIRRHPFPAALVGVGLLWMLSEQATGRTVTGSDLRHGASRAAAAGRTGIRRVGEAVSSGATNIVQKGVDRLSHARSDYEDYGSDGGSRARFGMPSGVERARDIGHRITDRASDISHRISDTAQHVADTATDSARRACRATSEAYDEYPMLFGLMALVGGLTAGLATPKTRVEKEAFGAAAQRLRRQAMEQGQRRAGEAIATAADKVEETVHSRIDRVESRIHEFGDKLQRGASGDGSGDRSAAENNPDTSED